MSVCASISERVTIPVVLGRSTKERLEFYRHRIRPGLYCLPPSPLRKSQGPSALIPAVSVVAPRKPVNNVVEKNIEVEALKNELEDERNFITDKIKRVDILLKSKKTAQIDSEECKDAKRMLAFQRVYERLQIIADKQKLGLSKTWDPKIVQDFLEDFKQDLNMVLGKICRCMSVLRESSRV